MPDSPDDSPRPPRLPPGVRKEILSEAPTSEVYIGPRGQTRPEDGDEAAVHYVGSLESSGSIFDSSRDRGWPFSFRLGQGDAVRGWDLCVATMQMGEVARFTLESEFAHGDQGCSEKGIPPNAALVFEIELISWMSKDDLFCDKGVIRTLEESACGWQCPKLGDTVLLCLKATDYCGSLVEDKPNIEYVLGSGTFDSLSRVVDKALTTMTRGELVSLKCSKDYACGDLYPNGAIVELRLLELHEVIDVSFSKDRSVTKTRIRESEDGEKPSDASDVVLAVHSVVTNTVEGFCRTATPEITLRLITGNGDVCDALECAVSEMKAGEHAIVTVSDTSMCSEPRLGVVNVQDLSSVVYTLELISVTKPPETWRMQEKAIVEFATSRKEVGGDLFKRGRTILARERYTQVVALLGNVNSSDERIHWQAHELFHICELNKAACSLKLGDFQGAKLACDLVLMDKENKNNAKALFRRASALLGLAEFEEALADIDRVLRQEPTNTDAKKLQARLKKARRDEDKKSADVYAKMLK